jgi:hypothetical protein
MRQRVLPRYAELLCQSSVKIDLETPQRSELIFAMLYKSCTEHARDATLITAR